MEKTTLILDCNYICFRSMLRMKELTFEQRPTGVVYGFLRQIQTLADKFQNPRFLFVWDSERSYRREIYPDYKRKTTEPDQEMMALLKISKPQFREVRCSVLPRLGFSNIFLQTGIEADDIIAKLIEQYWATFLDKIVIVSADNDLYQLLRSDVVMYDPKDKYIYKEEEFEREKKIAPDIWYKIKAIAGCSSDNVKGVMGVGELTAIKYIKGELKGKKLDDIRKFFLDGGYDRNVNLVKLPYISTRHVLLQEDSLNIAEFEKVCLDYGFHSLLSKESYTKWKRILST
jgi:DNA polymerase-1